MDLIYTDARGTDIGVMNDYTMDLAYGKEENDFSITVPRKKHCCEYDSLIYAEDTEYGGMVDDMIIDTKNESVTYLGRTWQGILDKKILCPDAGNDYYIIEGDANDVINEIIERTQLASLFEKNEDKAGIFVVLKARYEGAYNALRKAFAQYSAKLIIRHENGKLNIYAKQVMDYSIDESWDSSQMNLQIEKRKRNVNHLVCLGSGDLRNRAVIHLFADESGGIMQYTKVDEPLEDADYILDESMRVVNGKDEIVEIYDYPNAATTENYTLIYSKPSDWKENIGNYYKMEDGKMVALAGWSENIYTLLSSEPADWKTNFANYYTKSKDKYSEVAADKHYAYNVLSSKPSDWDWNFGSYYYANGSSYKSVGKEQVKKYDLQTTKPSNWESDYKSYYTYFNDGTEEKYSTVSGVTKYKYEEQTMKPSDWEENFTNYYLKEVLYLHTYLYKEYKETLDGNGKHSGWIVSETKYIYREEYIPERNDFDKKNCYPYNNNYNPVVTKYIGYLPSKEIYCQLFKYQEWGTGIYTKKSYSAAPEWEANTYYTMSIIEQNPSWKNNTYYSKDTLSYPEWASNTYYMATVVGNLPAYSDGIYYEKKIDRFAELVRYGLERFKEILSADSISSSFEPNFEYDIGDIVGANDEITGISISKPITKKIVKVGSTVEINYEIGE